MAALGKSGNLVLIRFPALLGFHRLAKAVALAIHLKNVAVVGQTVQQHCGHWFAHRSQTDTIVKMNKGAGKTLVGLLMLQSSLNEDVGPALYLCPTKQLVEQVVQQAAAYGIDSRA